MDWRAERLSLQAEIDTLKQEVQLLQVEKSSLEKARNPSFIHLSFSLSLSLSPAYSLIAIYPLDNICQTSLTEIQELSVTTLRSNSVLPGMNMATNLGEAFQQLLSMHASARRRVEDLNGNKSAKLTRDQKKELEDIERSYLDQVDCVRVFSLEDRKLTFYACVCDGGQQLIS